MTDLVGTCPKGEWAEWLAEGDAAGEPDTGAEYGWYTGHRLALEMRPGDRFYIVAHGRLRGWAPVTRVEDNGRGAYVICRAGAAVACTITTPLQGFRGLRARWWRRADERDFPHWRTAGVPGAAQLDLLGLAP